MCRQPGYVSHKMLLSTKRENVFLEIAEWESAEHHAAAIASEGFRSRVQGLFGVIEKPTPDIYTVVHDSAADVAHAA
jgi:heme-degrading monooxygenase HmoA